MAQRHESRGIVDEVRTDLRRFHDQWMELVYPRQASAEGTVLGRYRPRDPGELLQYRLWGAIGAVVVGLLYPVALFGVVVRFHARQVDFAAAWLGLLGVLLVAVASWGLLTALAWIRFSYEGFLAVAAAGVVATVAAALALLFARVGGRLTTIFLAYPLGVTAFFLPPVVAAMYSPALAAVVLPGSESLAIWILDNALAPVGLAGPIRASFSLVGYAYVLMWFGLSIPVGWTLGILVGLANLVRPR